MLLRKLAELADQYQLRDVYGFGSRGREIRGRVAGAERHADSSASDVDIAVQPCDDRQLAALERVRLADDLERLFDVPNVDLLILSEASSVLAFEVIRGELLYTANPLAQAEHELYVLRRAADLAPFQRDRVQQILTSGAR